MSAIEVSERLYAKLWLLYSCWYVIIEKNAILYNYRSSFDSQKEWYLSKTKNLVVWEGEKRHIFKKNDIRKFDGENWSGETTRYSPLNIFKSHFPIKYKYGVESTFGKFSLSCEMLTLRDVGNVLILPLVLRHLSSFRYHVYGTWEMRMQETGEMSQTPPLSVVWHMWYSSCHVLLW